MGSVQEAVLEFDEEIQAPWRPRLVVVSAAEAGATSIRAPLSHPSRRSPSRVGVCRPPVAPAGPALRPPVPTREGARSARPASAGPSAGSRPVPSRAATARLRLTRRARRLAFVLALAAGVALGSWVAPLLGGDADGLQLAGESSVVVRPGDTLWSIASSLDAGRDVRALIDEIQTLNHLSGSSLVPGQTLLIP